MPEKKAAETKVSLFSPSANGGYGASVEKASCISSDKLFFLNYESKHFKPSYLANDNFYLFQDNLLRGPTSRKYDFFRGEG